jgi:hypothetical protein
MDETSRLRYILLMKMLLFQWIFDFVLMIQFSERQAICGNVWIMTRLVEEVV